MEMDKVNAEVDRSVSTDGDSGIQGVVVCSVALHVNPRGHLMEVQRVDDPHYPGFGQVYITSTNPGVIKAWYRHREQLDQIAPVSGQVKLVLYDSRLQAPSHGQLMQVMLSAAQPLLVQIPPGVWHGFQAIGEQPAYLLHLNAKPFIHGAVDEERLPYDSDLIPYCWSLP
ncbi:MAG: dTDP-4-dehydrorhamnose 3,5-epimerase family protein [Cyanobium sp.]